MSSADDYSLKSLRNASIESNSLDSDQARHLVRPDLGPNCLQRLSANDKVTSGGERAKYSTTPSKV